ncbi:ead/Ea22-like family protein [Klebsiella quasipneumoniae]|uniref:ead/Ea22-like family protein n=1 Tax=Klebsiella quasipneumoniae TaxID=1463165 RepID=UPI0030F47EAA
MTTDITELAQSLKAAANKAGADDWQAKKISGDFYVIRKGSYSSQCGYRTYQPIAEIDHKSTRDYVAIASPANILALVEALENSESRLHEVAVACATAEQALEKAQQQTTESENRVRKQNRHICELFDDNTALRQRIAGLESRTVTVKPEDADGVREEGNQFLVVRHPGKVPVIKHPVGQLEDYLLQILKADPLATIDIVTHRYYGAGGQFVKDADEYLHEMGIKREVE